MKNRYAHRSRISVAKTRQIVRCFAADLTALQAAELTGLNRNTVNRFYAALRERIAVACEAEKVAYGISQSAFVPKTDAGAEATNNLSRAVVFGIFERDGRVFTEFVPEAARPMIQGVIRGNIDLAQAAGSGEWPGYDGIVDLDYGHQALDDGGAENPNGRLRVEGFWGMAKVRFAKFNGVPRHTFHLHLKETEWRYNNRTQDKYKTLLAYLKNDPLT